MLPFYISINQNGSFDTLSKFTLQLYEIYMKLEIQRKYFMALH